MHDCPFCFQACDCDGEDTWLEAPDDCSHECEEEELDDWYDPPVNSQGEILLDAKFAVHNR